MSCRVQPRASFNASASSDTESGVNYSFCLGKPVEEISSRRESDVRTCQRRRHAPRNVGRDGHDDGGRRSNRACGLDIGRRRRTIATQSPQAHEARLCESSNFVSRTQRSGQVRGHVNLFFPQSIPLRSARKSRSPRSGAAPRQCVAGSRQACTSASIASDKIKLWYLSGTTISTARRLISVFDRKTNGQKISSVNAGFGLIHFLVRFESRHCFGVFPNQREHARKKLRWSA